MVFVLSGYLIHAFVGRLLKPADYGRYGLIVTLATMTIVFIGDGIPKALSKYISEYPEKEKIIKKKAAILQIIIVSITSVVYFFSAPLIAAFFKDASLIPLIRLSVLIVPAFAAASFYNHYFNGLQMFGRQAIQRAFRGIVRIIVIIALAYYYGIVGAIVGYIIAPFLVFIFSFFLDKSRKKPTKGDFPYKKIFRFGLGIVGFTIAYNMVINVDLFLTKRILGNDYLVGIYNAVINIGRIPFYLFSNLAFILLPTISNIMGKKSHQEIQALIKNSLRFIFLLIIPTVSAVILFSRDIIKLFYSNHYIDGDIALKIFVVGVGALTIFWICVSILNGSGNVKYSAFLTWGGLGVNILLNYLLIPRFGIVGSATATATTSFVLMVCSLYSVRKIFGNFLNFSSVARAFLATLITYALFSFLPKNTLLLIPELSAYFVIYFAILSVSGEMSSKDWRKLKNIFSKKPKDLQEN